MITWLQLGIVKPIDRLSLNTFSIFPILKNSYDALKDSQWHTAMYDEYNALVKNGSWILVPRPTSVNMIRSIWLFKHKFHAEGTLSRYKACLVVNGSSQQLGVDFDEIFILVVKPATIRTVLSLVVSRQWPIHKLDVKNAFLNDALSNTVYMYQLPIDTESKLGLEGVLVQNPTLYRSLVGCPSTRSTFSLAPVPKLNIVVLLVAKIVWLRNLLHELHSPLSTSTLVYSDNVSAVYMSTNPLQHQWTKHIEINIHFLRDMVTDGEVRVLHVPSRYQYADIFTKGQPSVLFKGFRSSLSVRPPPATTMRVY
ncbi:ribonuclease H-like domain-containing protein [Tanacetum coccineum]